jgi:hypothetical protein
VKGTKTDKQERRERIKEFRYNREYERCMTEEIPERERECKRQKKLMTRVRSGYEERENSYWMEGEGRRCRMC